MPRKKKAVAPKDLSASYDMGDFNTLAACSDGRDITIKNPITGHDFDTPTGKLTIKVVGPSSKAFQLATDKMVKKLKKVLPNMSIMDMLNSPNTPQTTGISIEFLTSLVIGWDNVYMKNDEGELSLVDYTNEEATDLINELDWIRPQIEEFAKDSLNFIKG